MTAMERELEAELDKDFTAPQEPPLRLTPKKEQTLLGQWGMLEKVEVELRSRIRREEHAIRAAAQAEAVRIEDEYALRMSDALAALEAEKKLKLRDLVDQTVERLRDHETLQRRLA